MRWCHVPCRCCCCCCCGIPKLGLAAAPDASAPEGPPAALTPAPTLAFTPPLTPAPLLPGPLLPPLFLRRSDSNSASISASSRCSRLRPPLLLPPEPRPERLGGACCCCCGCCWPGAGACCRCCPCCPAPCRPCSCCCAGPCPCCCCCCRCCCCPGLCGFWLKRSILLGAGAPPSLPSGCWGAVVLGSAKGGGAGRAPAAAAARARGAFGRPPAAQKSNAGRWDQSGASMLWCSGVRGWYLAV